MKNQNKKSFFAKLRNNFIAGIVVLIPIGITLYLTLFIIKISGKIIPKKILNIRGSVAGCSVVPDVKQPNCDHLGPDN